MLQRASLSDTARILALVLAPLVARGAVIRRPRVLPVVGRLELDRRAGALLAEMRERYDSDPLRLRLPGLAPAGGSAARATAAAPSRFGASAAQG